MSGFNLYSCPVAIYSVIAKIDAIYIGCISGENKVGNKTGIRQLNLIYRFSITIAPIKLVTIPPTRSARHVLNDSVDLVHVSQILKHPLNHPPKLLFWIFQTKWASRCASSWDNNLSEFLRNWLPLQ